MLQKDRKKNTKKFNAAPADEKKPKTRGKRSPKGQNLTFTIYLATFSISIQIQIRLQGCPFLRTNTIKSQRVEEVIKTKRNSVSFCDC